MSANLIFKARTVLLPALVSAGILAGVIRGTAAGPEAGPSRGAGVPLSELLEVLKTNLVGTTAGDLNRAAVAGLLEQLAPRVVLVEDGSTRANPSPAGGSSGPALTSAIFDRSFGYVRLRRLESEAGARFTEAVSALMASNTLRGLVVDLRFCAGGDYRGAVSVADAFFSDVRDLVDWGEGMKRSTAKATAIHLPTTVLINRQTAGPAEVLAGILRQGNAGLLVGTNTAGMAGLTREVALSTGQRLRVAVAPVKVLDGLELPFAGLAPDVGVTVDADEERLFLADAYRVVKGTVAGGADAGVAPTNSRPRRRINEAELVRMTREGQDPREAFEGAPTLKSPEPAAPAVSDPVLVRALDILKGLAVVQRLRG